MKCHISWQFVQFLAELLRADGRTDGRTDMTKPVVAFHNFANALESGTFESCSQFGETFYAWDYYLNILFYNAFSELQIHLQYIQETYDYVSEEKHYKSSTKRYKSSTKIFYLNHTKSFN